MRYIIILITAILFIFTACKKNDVDQLFDGNPEARVSDTLKLVKDELISAEYGWIGGIQTGSRGGYGFYMQFKENDEVEMLSDFSDETASELQSSTYRLSFNFFTSLVFDTYNYITLMHDPVPGVAGGAAGSGYRSDIEYSFQRISGDSIIFSGKKYKHPLILIRASKEEQESYLNGKLKDFKNQFKEFYNDNYQFAYLGEEGQSRFGVELDYDRKSIQISKINEQSGIDTVIAVPFYYTPNSIELINGPEWNNKVITGLQLGSNNALDIIYKDGDREALNTQGLPLYDITEVFNYNKNFNKVIWRTIPEVNETKHIYEEMSDLFLASGRQINEMYFELRSSTAARFYIHYTAISSGSDFIAEATYRYRLEGDRLFITHDENNGNWNTRSTQIRPADELFGKGNKNDEREFVIEWTTSSDKSVKIPIGAIRSVDTPESLIYGALGK